jgi:hypothetical protein
LAVVKAPTVLFRHRFIVRQGRRRGASDRIEQHELQKSDSGLDL